MRKIFPLLGLLALILPRVAMAQQFQGVEFYGGYSYLKENLSSTHSPFYLSPTPFGNSFSLNGWQASITENATDWLGLTQEFGGAYGTERLQGLNNHFNMFSILSGPRFSYPRLKGVTPFAHALFGYDQMTVSLPGTSLSVRSSSYAMALGGGMDVKLSRRLALRLFQADYYMTRDFGSTQNNLRFSAGIVFGFGGRR
jgi:opacity protein-like surface antigen